ncbi:hypothetical protein AB0395_21810 [Streptosporangium sp. NPDC051023]|uniref:hypothetical protein n=1 Tax=Streptosporangium sp. NPDC051023 TaxID=3155410 RepID=UPI00344FBDF3
MSTPLPQTGQDDQAPDPVQEASREAFMTSFTDSATLGIDLEERVDAALAARDAVLTTAGYLRIPTAPPTDQDLDDAARLLAHASAFPRFADGDGWRRLRHSPHLVAVAAIKARARLAPGQEERINKINEAEEMLTAPPRRGAEEGA